MLGVKAASVTAALVIASLPALAQQGYDGNRGQDRSNYGHQDSRGNRGNDRSIPNLRTSAGSPQ